MSYFLYVQLKNGQFGFLHKTMRTKKRDNSQASHWFELAYSENDRDDILSFISQSAAENYVKNLADTWDKSDPFPIVYWEIVVSDN